MTGRLHPVVVHHVVNTLGWSGLRPLQEAALEPVLGGQDALLLAPTAGGKTEAAVFPLLTRMEDEQWRGLSVLYVCPLRALLNNLEPRLQGYTAWTGRRAALWHGDVGAGARQRLLVNPPDILLTTPESLEAMLVSAKVDAPRLFADLRTVIVDEVHAFAGDDRGWHLLGVLARLERLSGRRLQRLGLSATVGNPEQLLGWLRGGRAEGAGVVVDPPRPSAAGVDLQLDHVGTLDNSATLIASLHHGEKRLVFADSRRTVEDLAVRLRARGTDTFLSHSSLSRDERHRAEQAFAESRDCVIVSTSTLELGIDVGDLDRVIQLGAPRTVASFLQRLGRTGRREETSRNALLVALTDDDVLRCAALLRLHAEGFVEPVVPPPWPWHVVAQQLLALCLQRSGVGRSSWFDELEQSLPLHEGPRVADWLLETGHLDSDSDLLFVGPAAEARYGARHFLELLSVFTSDPQFTVLNGRQEVGTVDPLVLTRRVDGPRVLSLAGRAWLVTHTDWRRRRCFVEPSTLTGVARWAGAGAPLSFALTDAMRRVVLDGDVGAAVLTRRAQTALDRVRAAHAGHVSATGNVISHDSTTGPRLWTWAGGRANVLIAEGLPGFAAPRTRLDDRYVPLLDDAPPAELSAGLQTLPDRLDTLVPSVDEEALRQLTFSELLPPDLAVRCLGARQVDLAGAQKALGRR